MKFAVRTTSLLFSFLFTTVFSQYNGTAGFPNSTSTAENATIADAHFWLEDIEHQGVAAFRQDSTYQVFRNVKSFGAKGDGINDDTAAINLAISSGRRCGPGSCESSTTSPAVVYFPAGIYRTTSPIIDYYYTQIVGNPNSLPVIKAASNFTAFALIDGDQYQPGNAADPAGKLGFKATNTFYRQIRNLILDTTGVPPNVVVNGIHWPTAQATSLQNVVFRMSEVKGTQHQGLLIEDGSGGFMGDLAFYGGSIGATLGNQQFTSRNLSFYGCVTAINQAYDWGWTYKSINIKNCSIGLNMTSGGAPAVGSVTFIDSCIEDTPIGMVTAQTSDPSPSSNGSLILENASFKNVHTAIQGPQNTTMLGGSSGSMYIAGWGRGHLYNPNGPHEFDGVMSPFSRPDQLVRGSKYYERSKPSYADIPASQFLSVRTYGAKGDGVTDDTAALQKAISAGAQGGKLVFIDSGTYRVTETICIPSGSKLVGESYPVIMSSGQGFARMDSRKSVIQVGKSGEAGNAELSDIVIATQGSQPGALLIEWNLDSSGEPSGMWDVHTRIGGFSGSKLQLADCPATPGPAPGNHSTTANSTSPASATGTISASNPSYSTATGPYSNSTGPSTGNSSEIDTSCIGAFMSMHISKTASGLYMENNWLWTADHDLDAHFTNITVYSGRGLYIESEKGNIWLVASSVEHHALYQYQLANTKDIFMGQIQTETAYYQPHPDISAPFRAVQTLNDPTDAAVCHTNGTNCDGWGLRILDSQNVNVYGAGLYSFFNDYNNSCSFQVNGDNCQTSIFSIEGKQTHNINVYNLNTVGAISMIDLNGVNVDRYSDNVDVFPDNIAVFRFE